MTMQSPHRGSNPVIDAAYGLATSRRMCCADDLTLLVNVVRELPHGAEVVQLGAGSGTMALAIMGAHDDIALTSVDHDQQNLNWELQALQNAGVDAYPCRLEGGKPCLDGHRYEAWHMDSVAAGGAWGQYVGCQIDLLIIDADHSYEGVLGDLGAWAHRCDLVFIHDYDGTKAPQQYPGVRQACDERWGAAPPLYKAGWSAVFPGHADEGRNIE